MKTGFLYMRSSALAGARLELACSAVPMLLSHALSDKQQTSTARNEGLRTQVTNVPAVTSGPVGVVIRCNPGGRFAEGSLRGVDKSLITRHLALEQHLRPKLPLMH